MDKIKRLIVIGASAGGIPAIREVVSGLSVPDAAVLVVLHVSPRSDCDIIAADFQKHTNFKCSVVYNSKPLMPDHLYIAAPDNHLLVDGNNLVIARGPHENRYRPSIDVLFRSAAVSFGNRSIAIVLTGLLDDGTSGMMAVKRCGGICIVQDPASARFPDMPQSVMNNINVDYMADAGEIAEIVNHVGKRPLPPEVPVPEELRIEAEITENMTSDIDVLKKIADRSDFSCPDCGGGLWKVKGDSENRYRCHTGHVYTEKLLGAIQDEKIEESVWVSIRMLEEKANLMLLMGKRTEDGEFRSRGYEARYLEITRHINTLRSFLLLLKEDIDPPATAMEGNGDALTT